MSFGGPCRCNAAGFLGGLLRFMGRLGSLRGLSHRAIPK